MREYRYYNSILWGKRYNPETGAHHISAEDYDSARAIIPISTWGDSIQVKTCQGWQWAKTVPVHLGGYDCDRYA